MNVDRLHKSTDSPHGSLSYQPRTPAPSRLAAFEAPADAISRPPANTLPGLPQPAAAQALAPPTFTIGNKSANLMAVASAPRRDGVVPALVPLSHEQMAQALQQRGVPLEAMWQRFVETQGSSQHLNAGGTPILAALRNQIERAFATRPIFDLDPWLQAHAAARLMVRSDGAEDTRTATNAGGARSIANLAPRREDVSRAIGEVIASYFGERSLLQRRDAGDDICKPPLLSVFLQVMVGESLGGEIPISGVLHTRELEGPTPGMAVINATYGHNEGVVNAGAATTDTIYVSADDNLQYIERIKAHRLAPSPAVNGALLLTHNTKLTRANMAVSPLLARKLAKVGRELEVHFGYPLDIEWTSLHGTLYILQARPLVAPFAPPASYVDTQQLAEESVQTANVIVSGGAHVRLLEGRRSAVIADTLPAALEHYLMRKDRALVRAVIVAQGAPATSHEAATLRAAGVAVLQTDACAHVARWLDANIPALVCPQSGQLVRLDSLAGVDADALQAQLRARGVIVDGQVDHPIPATLSNVFPAVLRTPEQSLALIGRLVVATPSEMADDLRWLSSESLLAWLRDPSLPLASWAFATLMERAAADLLPLLKDASLGDTAARVTSALAVQAQNVSRGLQAGRVDTTYLAAVKWLRACLTQEPGNDALDADSVRSLKRAFAQRPAPLRLTQPTPIVTMYAESLERVGLACGHPTVRQDWNNFATALLSEGATVAAPALATLVHEVTEAGVLAEWLRSHFATAWNSIGGTPKSRAQACLAALLRRASQGEFKGVRAFNRDIAANLLDMRRNIDNWANPDGFDALLPKLKALVSSVGHYTTDELSPEGALKFLVSPDPVVQGLVSTRLHDVVEAIDASIKALAGSEQYVRTPRLKAERWLSMLEQYAQLCGSLVRIVERPEYDQAARMLDTWTIPTLISEVSATADDALETLFVKPGLDIEPFLIGIADVPELPNDRNLTLDFFFTVAHQNVLQALALLSGNRLQAQLSEQAPQVRNAAQAVMDLQDYIDYARAKVRLLDVQTSASRVDMRFSVPLRNHGVNIDARIDFSKYAPPSGRLTFRMVGDTEESHRMERMIAYLGIAEHSFGLQFSAGGAPVYDGKALSFCLELNPPAFAPEALKKISQVLGAMVEISFKYANGAELDFDADPRQDGLRGLLDVFEQHGVAPDIDALPDAFFSTHPYFNGDALAYIMDDARRRRIAAETLLRSRHIPRAFAPQLKRCAAELGAGDKLPPAPPAKRHYKY